MNLNYPAFLDSIQNVGIFPFCNVKVMDIIRGLKDFVDRVLSIFCRLQQKKKEQRQ